MKDVVVVHWNPKAAHFPGELGQFISRAPRKNNFGDMLGPEVVDRFRAQRAPSGAGATPRLTRQDGRTPRLLCIGSILHLAREGDVVWGTGVNGKIHDRDYRFSTLDVRAVRGPLTLDFLRRRGIEAPDVFGDPGLLLPELWPGLREAVAHKRYRTTVLPNLNEIDRYSSHPDFLSPRAPIADVVERIAGSERVVGSSLHAIVIADALGVPSSLIRTAEEPSFKYDDYFRGTGRESYEVFGDLGSALAARPRDPELSWDPAPLAAAFPWDLWND